MELLWKEIKPGDTVILRYRGYGRVPRRLNHEPAVVLKRNKVGNLVVVPSEHMNSEQKKELTIKPTDIWYEETFPNYKNN